MCRCMVASFFRSSRKTRWAGICVSRDKIRCANPVMLVMEEDIKKSLVTCLKPIILIGSCCSSLLLHVMIIFGVIISCRTERKHWCQSWDLMRTSVPVQAQTGLFILLNFVQTRTLVRI